MKRGGDDTLQSLCREYLTRLRYTARKHGLDGWLSTILRLNKRKECEATQREVDMLARMVDDERASRLDIPVILGKTYRSCVDDGDFNKIRKLRHVGTYSKTDAIIYANNKRNANNKKRHKS